MNDMNVTIKEISHILANEQNVPLYPTGGVKDCFNRLLKNNRESIDKIIYISTTIPEYIFWADYAKIHFDLGLEGADIIKIYQGKTAIISAIDYARALLELESSLNNILILCGESYCNMYDRIDEISNCFLSDGCCALVIGREKGLRIVNYETRIIETSDNLFFYPQNAQFSYENIKDPSSLYMKYSIANVKVENFSLSNYINKVVGEYSDIITESIQKAHLDSKELVKIIVPNIGENYIRAICEKAKIDIGKLSWEYCNKLGHFGASDLIINLSIMLEKGSLKEGDIILLVAHSYEGRISALTLAV